MKQSGVERLRRGPLSRAALFGAVAVMCCAISLAGCSKKATEAEQNTQMRDAFKDGGTSFDKMTPAQKKAFSAVMNTDAVK